MSCERQIPGCEGGIVHVEYPEYANHLFGWMHPEPCVCEAGRAWTEGIEAVVAEQLESE